MRSVVRCLIAPSVALLLASCASPAKLARQSSDALERGDLHRAYDRALSAVEKDPANQDARAAYGAASRQVVADLQQRVTALALADTLSAADLALDLRRIRLEVARHQTPIEAAPGYDEAERVILRVAARTHYQRGVEAMSAHRPKAAVDEFTLTRRYDDAFGDVAVRLDVAAREAATRVALLPFTDGIGVPGLSREIGDSVQRELSRRAAREFRFIQLVGADEIERQLTVAAARNIRREDALAVGRRVGARWVIVGRFLGLRASNTERELKMPLYHRVDGKDDKGAAVVRWDESQLQVVTREREVTVQYDFEVLDVASGAVLAHGEEPAQARVRVAWSDYRSGEDFDRYALLPSDARKNDPARARKVDAQWRDHLGSWTLGDLLRQSRDQRARSRYSSRYRGEFYADTRERPVWLGELPTENDLAYVALRDAWRPVLAVLKTLDAKED